MDKTTYISFPGLGIDEFAVRNVAFSVFGRDVMWYGIIITFGIIAAVAYAIFRAKHNEGIKSDHVLDYAIFLVIFGVIGARLYYVLMKFSDFKGQNFGETFSNIIAIWNGGLAIYGGIIAGFITLVIVSLVKKIKTGKALDMIGPGVMIAQSIGRWGNFFNAEAHGGVTSLPWRMGLRGANETVAQFVHPTFFYESLWNLIGFIIINLVYKKKKFDGQIFLMYISWYGFGRMFIEGLRTDSLYIGDFRVSQLVGFFCFFFGTALIVSMLIVTHIRKQRECRASCTDTACEAVDEITPSEPICDAEADHAAETVADDPFIPEPIVTEPTVTESALSEPAKESSDSENSASGDNGFEISDSYGESDDDED